MTQVKPNKLYLYTLLKKLRRETARRDILYFAKYYLHDYIKDETPLFHKEIYKLLQTENRLAIAAPRGFAKSTITQIVYGLWCLLFNEGDDIISISLSADLANDWVRKLKFEFEGNERILEDFGGILDWGEKKSKRWTADHLVIQKDGRVYSQVRARGRGCQVRGLRPTRVFCDDLEDEQLVRSEEQRKQLKQWFLGALMNVLRVDQQLVVIGTVLHPVSLLNKMMKKKEEFASWTVRKYQAITEGESIWEKRFPLKELLRKKFEIGTYAFQAEFQNEPVASDICLWRPHWIKTYKKLPEIIETFMGLDPAISIRESADYTAAVIWGIGVDGKIYEIESVQGRWGTWDFIDRVIKLYLKHKPIRIGIEKEKIEMVIKPVLLKEARKRGIHLPVHSIELGSYKAGQKRASRDKFSRAMTIIHLFEQDLVRLKSQDLIDQLSMFPTGEGDDLVDAAVHGLHMIQRYSAKASVFRKTVVTARRILDSVESFVIKDNKMPCLSSIEECFERSNDWRIGG